VDHSERVTLLDDVGSREAADCACIIWDDARPRQMHLWPEGNRWGATPPLLHMWKTESSVRTYTVCGRPVSNHMLHQRAGRGQWASYFRGYALICQVSEAAHAGTEPPRYTYGDEQDARRICRDCAVASAQFPECIENTDQGPPDWWFGPVRIEAANAITAQLKRDKAFASLHRLEVTALKAYRAATGDWLARSLKLDGEAALRRLFGNDLRDIGQTTRTGIHTEYDELERLAARSTKRKPHELLSENDWCKLIKAYLPGAPARDMNGKDWYHDAPHRRFRADVRGCIESRCKSARAKP
jgi:hypothetical protein